MSIAKTSRLNKTGNKADNKPGDRAIVAQGTAVVNKATSTVNVSAVPEAEAWSMRQAQRIDTATMGHLDTAIKASETSKSMWVELVLDVLRCFPADVRADWPDVGTTEKQIKEKYGKDTNRPWDECKVKRLVNNGYREITTTRSALVFEFSTAGKAIVEKIKQYDMALGEHKDTPKELIGRNVDDLRTERDKLDNNRKTGITQFREAMDVVQQMDRIDSQLPLVKWRWVNETDTQGTVIGIKRAQNALVIYNAAEPTDTIAAKPMGKTQFTSYDVEEAAKNGGTLAALKKTVSRDTEKQPVKLELKANSKDSVQIVDASGFVSWMQAGIIYADVPASPAAMKRERDILDELIKDRHAMISFDKMSDWLDAIATKLRQSDAYRLQRHEQGQPNVNAPSMT